MPHLSLAYLVSHFGRLLLSFIFNWRITSFFHRKLWLFLSFVAGALLSLIYISQIHLIGEWFNGKSIEVSVWLSQFFVYLLTLVLAYGLSLNRPSKKSLWYWVTGLMVSLTIASEGSNFILYFDGYLNQSNVIQPMLLGTFLGLGICLSSAVSLYLAAQWLKHQLGPWAIWSFI